MPLSSDPEKRARQLANLTSTPPPAPAGNMRHLEHGAKTEQLIRPLREKYLAELVEAFPSATRAELVVQAQRLAQLELLNNYLDERGVIRHQRRGDVFPAAALAEQIAKAWEKQHDLLLKRERARTTPPAASLEAVLSELREDGDDATR